MTGAPISPASRQQKYLTADQAVTLGGKFIKETTGNVSDPEVPGDVVNRTPPHDGRIASAGNSSASAVDTVVGPDGSAWQREAVKSGQAVPMSIKFDRPRTVRRGVAYLTKPNWDEMMPLSRYQFDLEAPVLQRTYTAAEGLLLDGPLEFRFPLPRRSEGYHVLLVEVDFPDSGDALYQVIDLDYTS